MYSSDMDLCTQHFELTYEDDAGRIVRGVVTRPAEQSADLPGVIVVHGFKGFLRWGFFPELQSRLAQAGLVSIAVNLSGSGVGEDLESFTDDEGFFTSTPSKDVEDVACVRSFLAASDLGVDTSRLALLGHSRGGGTALLQAEEAGDYAAVVTWAAVSRTLRFPEETIATWRAQGALEIPNARTGGIHRLSSAWLFDAEDNAAALDIRAACARSSTPTLLVHGTEDEAVPFEEALLLEASFAPGTATLHGIEGAGHTFGAVHPMCATPSHLERAFGVTLGFLAERLR